MRTAFCLLALPALCWITPAKAAEAPDAAGVQQLIEDLQRVGPMAAGHGPAQDAWRKLSKLDPDQLPQLLAALDQAGPLAANWIRSAIDVIAQRSHDTGGQLPKSALEEFLGDRSHAPRARRLAFELLAAADPAFAERAADMLDDPSVELRRDAVAQVLDAGRSQLARDDRTAAQASFQRALQAARDLDQLKAAGDELKKLGINVDLPRQLGFITAWKVIGPCENTDGKGFATVYPPEEKIDLAGSIDGPGGKLRWQDVAASGEIAVIDFNRALGTHKEVVGYAYAEFVSARRQRVDLRLATDNAFRLWVNGKLVRDAEIYHAFTTFDQYIAQATLEPGVNRILVKLCQNAQTEEWANDWRFQLRVCDATGGVILPAE